MRKFHFRFETVRDVRKHREREALAEMLKQQAQFRTALERKRDLLNDLSRTLERREDLSGQASVAAEFQIESLYVQGLKARLVQSDHQIARDRKKFEKAMAFYGMRVKDRKVLDKLYDRLLERYRKDEKRRELKLLDDLYSSRARLSVGQGEESHD